MKVRDLNVGTSMDLAQYDINIAALSVTRLCREYQPIEFGVDYIFFGKGCLLYLHAELTKDLEQLLDSNHIIFSTGI